MSTRAHISYDQYSQIVDSGALADRHLELVCGEIREMFPFGPAQENAIDLLLLWSGQNLDLDVVRMRIRNSIGLPEIDSCLEPDVLWVPQKSYRHERPEPRDVLLLIEVADSSLSYDMGEKADLYAAAGVVDYWVVDLEHGRIEVFREPSPSGFKSHETFDANATVRPLQFPEVELATKTLFKV